MIHKASGNGADTQIRTGDLILTKVLNTVISLDFPEEIIRDRNMLLDEEVSLMIRLLELVVWNWLVGEIIIWGYAIAYAIWVFAKVKFDLTRYRCICDGLGLDRELPMWKKILLGIRDSLLWWIYLPKTAHELHEKTKALLTKNKDLLDS